jgi:hypothetical protein
MLDCREETLLFSGCSFTLCWCEWVWALEGTCRGGTGSGAEMLLDGSVGCSGAFNSSPFAISSEMNLTDSISSGIRTYICFHINLH